MSFILQAFEFVEHDCNIQILPPDRTYQDYLDFFRNADDKKTKLVRILIAMGTLSKADLKKINQWKRKSTFEQTAPSEYTKQESIESIPNNSNSISETTEEKLEMIPIANAISVAIGIPHPSAESRS